MYIRKEKKKHTSLLRVFILTVLILLGLWFLRVQPDWARPFEASPTPTLQAGYYINAGDIDFAEGRVQSAIDNYEHAISLEPENDTPYIRQAKLLIFAGDSAKALSRSEKAVLLNPDSAENLAGYCQTLDWEGQYGSAFDACECAIELDPNYAPGYAFLSEVYADQASWVAARQTAQQALDVDFQNPEAHYDMGYALEVQGRYKDSIEFYENAITLRPKLAAYYLAAGRNYYWLGRFEDAIDRFGEAIKLSPNDGEGYEQLGWTFHANGQDSRAIDALEQAISVAPLRARTWGRLGTIYYLRQNYEEALKILPTAVELSERQQLNKVRQIEIYSQIDNNGQAEDVPILKGRFESNSAEGETTISAQLLPVQWAQNVPKVDAAGSCGQLIAYNIQEQIILTSPTQDISFSEAYSQSHGTATLNLNTGEISIDIENLPRPESVPYNAQIRFRSDELKSIGYIQPDSKGRVNETFTLDEHATAPVEYYYELGLSYAYLRPPQCEKAVPWLLKAVDKDPVYYNPAWEGLKICPSDQSPPTPLPTFTPLPTVEGK